MDVGTKIPGAPDRCGATGAAAGEAAAGLRRFDFLEEGEADTGASMGGTIADCFGTLGFETRLEGVWEVAWEVAWPVSSPVLPVIGAVLGATGLSGRVGGAV